MFPGFLNNPDSTVKKVETDAGRLSRTRSDYEPVCVCVLATPTIRGLGRVADDATPAATHNNKANRSLVHDTV